MKKAPIIVLTGGGSGGHITPLLSLAHALKKAEPSSRVIYIGLKNEQLESNLRQRYRLFDEVRTVSSGKFRRYHGESILAHLIDIRTLALNARDFFRVIKGTIQAYRLLGSLNPDVVFSKGSFVAVPVGLAARVRNVLIITHDSDVVPGLANRLIGRFARVHATGMPANNYNYPAESTIFTGIPLDERIKKVSQVDQKKFKTDVGIPADARLLLVGGAGLGAKRINHMMLAIAEKLLQDEPDLHIIHFAGAKHQEEVKAAYDNLGSDMSKRVETLAFSPEFYKYTGAADLVITRAGATTLAELAVQQKPVILIPAPQLTGGHQLKNAEKLKKIGAAEVVADDSPPEYLQKTITNLLSKPAMMDKLSVAIGSTARKDAAEHLADLIIKTARQIKT